MADDVSTTASVNVDGAQAQQEIGGLRGIFQSFYQGIIDGANGIGPANQKVETSFAGVGKAVTGNLFSFNQLVDAGKNVRDIFETVWGAGAKVVGGIWDIVKSTADAGDHFFTLSHQTGLSAEALSSFKYVGEQTGTTVESIANNVFKMGINLEKGGKQTELALHGIGLSSKELKDLKPEEQFTKIIDGLKGIPDAGGRAAVGVAIFGKGFKDIAQLVDEDIDGMLKNAKAFGLVMSDEMAAAGDRFSDTMNDMSSLWTGLKNIIGFAVLPIVNVFIGTLRDELLAVFGMLKNAFAPLFAGFGGFSKGLQDTGQSAEFHTKVLQFLVTVIAGLIDAFAGTVRALGTAMAAYYEFRIASNLIGIAFNKVVEGILEGAKLILDALAKITPGEAGKKFAEWSTQVGTGLDNVRAATTKAKAELPDLDAKSKAISGTMGAFADKLNVGADALRKQGAEYKGTASAIEPLKKGVAGLGDDLDLTGAKLTGVAKKMADWTKSTAELDAEIQMAMQHGVPMNVIIETYGKKAAEAATQGRIFGKDVSASIQMVADTLEARDIGVIMQKQTTAFAKEQDKLNKATEDALHKNTDAIGKNIIEASKVYDEFQTKITADSLNGTDKRLFDIERERKARLAAITGVGPIFDMARKEINDYYDHQTKIALGSYDTIVERMKSAGVQTKDVQQKQVDDFKRDYEQMKASGQFTTEQLYAAWKKYYDAEKGLRGGWASGFMGTLDQLSNAFAQLAQIGGDSFKGMAKDIGQSIGTMKLGMTAATGFTDTLAGMKDGSIKTGAGMASLATNTAGMIGSMQQATDHASRTSNALHGMAQGAMIGTAIMPGWGTAVGAAVGLVWGAIKGVPDWSKLTNEIQRDFDANISKPLADKIAETAKDFGDRSTATMMHLSDILKDIGGITVGNLATWTQKTHDLFSFIERGQLSVGDASKQLNEIFPQLAKTILDSNMVASKSFTDLIDLDQKFGTNSAAVAQFVGAEMTKMAGALQNIVGGFVASTNKDVIATIGTFSKAQTDILQKDYETAQKGADAFKGTFAEFVAQQAGFYGSLAEGDKRLKTTFFGGDLAKWNDSVKVWQDGFDRESRIALAAFNAQVAKGADVVSAMMSIGTSIDALKDAHDKLGLAGNAAFDELSRMRTLVTGNKELLDSVHGVNDMMAALGNLGVKDQQVYSDLQKEGLDTFAKMTAAGFTQQEAEQQMKPLLENIIKLHDERGIAIDDETQKMIDQAREDGVLSKQEQSTNQILQQGLSAVIKAVGGDIPEAWKKAADAGDNFANHGVAAAGNVAGALAGQTRAQVEAVQGKLTDTQWEQWQARAQEAARNAASAVSGVGGAAQTAASTVASSTVAFDRWRDIAVARAGDVQDAIDGVSFGASPGGIKEFVPMLRDASYAFGAFGDTATSHLRRVKSDVNALGGIHAGRYDATLTAAAGGRAGGGTVINVAVDMTKSIIAKERDAREFALGIGQTIADEHFKGAKVQVTKGA